MYYMPIGMTEVSVTRKGQITIPVELRRKYHIREESKVEVVDEGGRIVVSPLPSILDLAGSGSAVEVEEVKRELDKMRAQDA
jgi:AbrB family looped-hinge helix DNA binding protein